MVNISTLRPGLLVGLRTQLTGNVHYSTRDLEPDHIDTDGVRRAKWETERTVEDPAEHERGVKARGRARSIITAVCSNSAFGLLCPQSDSEKLTDAIAEARAVAAEFNATAALSRIAVNVIVGRIAADDVEAVRAINGEVRDLLAEMERGLKYLDVSMVREAANKARDLSAMLAPAAAERAQKAIEVARSAARRIVKAGETAAIEIDEATIRTIQTARMAFLDLEDGAELQVPVESGRAVDLEMEEMPPVVPVPAAVAFQIEL